MNTWFLNNDEKKMGLVLGGGGVRGCYEIGMWQAFRQAGIRFDVVSGTSIGALVGAIYTQQTLHPLEEFVWNLKPTHIAAELFAFPENLAALIKERKQIKDYLEKYILSDQKMNISPLKEAIARMFDYDKFRDSPIDFACMTFNVTKRRPEAYFKSEMTRENAQSIILASASCYPAFPMLEMDGCQYIDGGYWDNVPVDLALRMGADKILAVDVEGPGLVRPIPRKADVLLIKPMLPLPNFLDFSHEAGVQAMNIGYLETNKLLGVYVGYLFTFVKEDLQDMDFMEQYLAWMFMVHGIKLPENLNDDIFKSLVGFHPSYLSLMRQEDYVYGEMVEALAYMVHIDPVNLYDYDAFIRLLLKKLSEIKIDEDSHWGLRMAEYLRSLSKDKVLVILHKMICSEHGDAKEYMGLFSRMFPAEFYLAYVWYFIGLAYERTV